MTVVAPFKTLLFENDNRYNVPIEVELYFLFIQGYKDKAMSLKQKFS